MEGGGEFLLEQDFLDSGFNGLSGSEVGSEGDFGIAQDVSIFFRLTDLFIDLGEVLAYFVESGTDEGIGFTGGFTFFFLGVFVIGDDEFIEDIFCFLGVMAGDSHFEQGSFFFVGAHDVKDLEEVACHIDGRGMVDDDGRARGRVIEGGGRVDGDGSEGEFEGGIKGAFDADGLILGVEVGEREILVIGGGDFDSTGTVCINGDKVNEQGGRFIEVDEAQSLVLPVDGIEF